MNRVRSIIALAVATALAAAAACLSGCAWSGLRPVAAADPTKVAETPLVINRSDGVLRWQAFPRKEDEALFGPNARQRITNVCYDVKIWTPTGDGKVTEEPLTATGLTQPEYRLYSLSKGQTYRWTVRATFKFDGKPRVTQWTTVRPPSVWGNGAMDCPTFEVVEQ